MRNWLDSDAVAILDIHVVRAGRFCRLFNEQDRVERSYRPMERRFLEFARALGVRASLLDILIWDQMRRYHLWEGRQFDLAPCPAR